VSDAENFVDLENRVAIVTGAGRGLGREHALMLARHGARVVVNDLGATLDGDGNDESAAAQVVAEIVANGGEAVADFNSVTTPEGGQAIVDTAITAFNQVDIVVNNAGILRDKTFHNMADEFVEPVFDVHLRGAFNVTRPAWQLFRAQGFGRVINTTSAAGVLGNFGQTNYAAAKAGLVGFTYVLALEGAKFNITANAIAPRRSYAHDRGAPWQVGRCRSTGVGVALGRLALQRRVHGHGLRVHRGGWSHRALLHRDDRRLDAH
jgi:NAD(P)-dependent dehydrogenase (short-subunit alcohol dehydrogenase family)